MLYISIGYHINDGVLAAPSVRSSDNKDAMERQFYLYCASASTSENEIDVALMMAEDGTILKHEYWYHAPDPPESEPEPEPEPEEPSE